MSNSPAEPAAPATPAPPAAPASPARPAGKGRATPKRNEARKTRAVVPAPKTRKEALAYAREQRRKESQEIKAGLKSGDVSKLPARERLPERVFARDYVDARRNVGVIFLPIAALFFVGSMFPALLNVTQALWFASVVLVVVDSVRLARGLRKESARRFPGTKAPTLYAVSRATMPRRFRMPPARVTVGQQV